MVLVGAAGLGVTTMDYNFLQAVLGQRAPQPPQGPVGQAIASQTPLLQTNAIDNMPGMAPGVSPRTLGGGYPGQAAPPANFAQQPIQVPVTAPGPAPGTFGYARDRAFDQAGGEFGQGNYAAAAGNALRGVGAAIPAGIASAYHAVADSAFRPTGDTPAVSSPLAHGAQEFARGFTGAAPPATPMMTEFNNARQAAQSRPQSQPQPFATPVTNGDVLASVGQSFGHPTADSAFAASMRTQGNANPSTPEYYTSGIPGAIPPSNKGFVPAGATTGGYADTGGINDVGSAYNNFANDLVEMRRKGFQDLHHPELHGVQYPYIERSDEKRPFLVTTAEGRDAFYAAHPTYDNVDKPNSADETARSGAYAVGRSQTAPTVENYQETLHRLVDSPGKGYSYAPGGRSAEGELSEDWFKHSPRTFDEMAQLMPKFARQEDINAGHSNMWIKQMYRQQAQENAKNGGQYAPLEKLAPINPSQPQAGLLPYQRSERNAQPWETPDGPLTDQSMEVFGDRPHGSHDLLSQRGQPMGHAYYTGGQTPLPRRDASGAILPGQVRSPANGGWYPEGQQPGLTMNGEIVPPGRYSKGQFVVVPGRGARPPRQGEPAQGAIATQQPMSDREAFYQTLPPHMAAAIKTGHFSRDQVVQLLGQAAPQMTHERDPVWVGKNASANALSGMANLTAHGVTEDKNGNVVVDPRTLQLPADRLRALGADPANGDVAAQLIYQYNVHKRTNSIWSQFFNSIIPLMQQGQEQ